MQKHIVKAVLALLLAGSTLPSEGAQPDGWQAGGAIPIALNGLKDWTHQSMAGLCLDGGYQRAFEGGRVLFRASAGLNLFPGKEQEGLKISLTSLQVSGDLVIPVADSPFSLVTGLSVHNWAKKVSGRSPLDPQQGNQVSSNVRRSFGKIGFRAGVEYGLSARWTLSAICQVSELGTNSEFLEGGNEVFGTTAVNPSWVQVGVRYHF